MKRKLSDLAGRVKILIVNEQPLMREALAQRVSAQLGWQVCGEAADIKEALECVKTALPDVAIVDLAVSSHSGLQLIEEFGRRFPSVKIMAITAGEDAEFAVRALRAGAAGCLNTRTNVSRLLAAIREILSGERVVSDTAMQRILQDTRKKWGDAGTAPLMRLSNRELQVLQLIGEGMKTSSIARRLNLSVHTINSHRTSIRRKLSLKNGVELVRRAIEWVLEQV